MDILINKLQTNLENEEEDYESYFLQPASSPYNIAEKVQQANIDLFNNTTTMKKTNKVKFRDELATFEPELTDDDVNSIESDHIEIQTTDNNEELQFIEYKTEHEPSDLNIFGIDNEDDNVEDEEEDDDDEVIEEIEATFDLDRIDHNYTPTEDKNQDNNPQLINETQNFSRSSKNPGKRKKFQENSKYYYTNSINCKNHCIEKLDFDLSMSIKKLEIHEKPPPNCPLLKLRPKQCCDERKAKYQENLPHYNGLRSEYGLSLAELEKREKRKEVIKLKEQKREQLLNEYKQRRIEENEQVFCRWLKDVAKRKTQSNNKIKSNNKKSCFSPKVINFPNKICDRVKERPKTADEFVPRHGIKRARRPHTSQSSVFIEVPQKMLHHGINIGDLLITDSNFATKKLHILTVS